MADYTKADIVSALRDIGIKNGDNIFIHSNLGFFGRLENCKSSDALCEVFVSAIFETIGESGTLVVPTFSYSFCHGEVFNPETTPTSCGMLSAYFLRNYNRNRSLDPNFSICGNGRQIDWFRECNVHESFGGDSFWERFLAKDGKIVCMNFDSGSTMLHYIERLNSVPYRYNKAFNGIIESNGIRHRDYAVHFVYDYDRPEDGPFFPRLDRLCKANKISACTNLGRGTVLGFSTREYVRFVSDLLKERPRVLVRDE